MADSRLEERKKSFKQTSLVSPGASGESYARKLRKQKKNEFLRAKRMKVDEPQVEPPESYLATFNPIFASPTATLEEKVKVVAEALCNPIYEEELLLGLVRCIRKAVAAENPPIDLVVKLGLVEKVMAFFEVPLDKVLYEAAWIITNIAAGKDEHCNLLLKLGCPKVLVGLLDLTKADVAEQSMWALANIAGNSVKGRDQVLESGIVPKILEILSQEIIRGGMLENTYWTIQNLCKGKPDPPAESISPLLNNLSGILDTQDDDIVSDALWAWANLAESENFTLPDLLAKFPKEKLPLFLSCDRKKVLASALRLVGNVCVSSDSVVTTFMDDNVLKGLKNVLANETTISILKECCWITYNFAIGPSIHIERMVELGVFQALCQLLIMPSTDNSVKQEAANSIANSIVGASAGTLELMLKTDLVLQAATEALEIPDPKTVSHTLSALEDLLSIGAIGKYNPYTTDFHVAGGLDKLEELINHQNSVISNKAKKILDKYFYVPTSVEYQVEEDVESNTKSN